METPTRTATARRPSSIAPSKASSQPCVSSSRSGASSGKIGWKGNDYHPLCHMAPGEAFVASILNAVQTSPCWNETLLIINFDEHGGT